MRLATVGVFDSGFGGLTVLRELLGHVPAGRFVYLGDTARLPYGSKSRETIARYAIESARFLEERGADHLVVACNTASALALPEIQAAVRIPVTGVIEPAVAATERAHPGSEVLVLATAATVQSHAYRAACEAHGMRATEKACPLLVPLVEEGWVDHDVTREVIRIYLEEALGICSPMAVILGCTHYPLLAVEIERTLRALGSEAQVIDSALATAQRVQGSVPAGRGEAETVVECYVTDSVEKFERLGSAFLGREVREVRLVDLGG